jgi:hypothetical protein
MPVTNSHIIRRSLDDWREFCEQIKNSTSVNFTESKKAQEKRKAAALEDYNIFTKTYFPEYADADCAYFHIEAANRIKADKNIKAILEWPREHAKTVHACVILPMWLFVLSELDGMLLVSREYDMAANALGDIQAHLQFNELFKHDFGDHFKYGDWAKGDFTTKGGVRFLALGRGQAPQGARKGAKRPNVAVCSDLDDYEIVQNQRRVKEVVEYINGALIPALAIKGSRIIIEGNRIHPRSIIAHMVGDITPDTPKNKGIYHSKVYATEGRRREKKYISEGGTPAWKERYTTEMLSTKFNQVGIIKTKSEYYHDHFIDGEIFKDKDMHWKKMPHLRTYIAIIGYFDPSFENKPTSDYKALRIWGLYMNGVKPERHCLKSFVRKCELIKVFEAMSDYEDSLPLGVGVIWYMENQFYNRPVQDALYQHNQNRLREGKRTLSVTVDTRKKEDKYVRMVKMEPRYTNGEVFFNIDEMYNPDMIEGNNQLKGIAPGYKGADDAPDADEGDWHYLDQLIPGRNFTPTIGLHKHKTKY